MTTHTPQTDEHAAMYHPLVKGVVKGLRHHCHTPGDARVVVGVSGGVDSVALLRALHALSQRRGWGFRLVVAHVQHHLRGGASERDAAFVMRLAQTLDLPYVRRDIEVLAAGGNVEASARRLRYEALMRVAVEAGAPWVATAHHADDQLETLLMRMLRGASIQGMRGIAWRRRMKADVQVKGVAEPVRLIRPMLGVPGDMAADWLNRLGQPWCRDVTNEDVTRVRARLRRDVLPVLKDIRGDAPLAATRLAEHAAASTRQLRAIVRREAAAWRAGEVVRCSRTAARGLDPLVLAGVLREVLAGEGVADDALGRGVVGPIARGIRDDRGGERSWALAGGVQVVVTREDVIVEPAPA